jgi:hypothetical protein
MTKRVPPAAIRSTEKLLAHMAVARFEVVFVGQTLVSHQPENQRRIVTMAALPQ